MPREVDPSLNERAFILQALLEKTRPDGRTFNSYRQLGLTFGDEYGVAHVQLGYTKYVYNAVIYVYFHFYKTNISPELLFASQQISLSLFLTESLMGYLPSPLSLCQ